MACNLALSSIKDPKQLILKAKKSFLKAIMYKCHNPNHFFSYLGGWLHVIVVHKRIIQQLAFFGNQISALIMYSRERACFAVHKRRIGFGVSVSQCSAFASGRQHAEKPLLVVHFMVNHIQKFDDRSWCKQIAP